MKLIGLKGKSLQYLYTRLNDKVSISFPEDLRESEVLFCQNIKHYQKYSIEIHKKSLQYKVIIFLDYIKELERIKGIQILDEIPESFISYVKEKCTYAIPYIRLKKDTIIQDKIDTREEKSTFFTTIIYPLLCRGIIDKKRKKEVLGSLVLSIKSIIKRNMQPDIVNHKDNIRQKYYKAFLQWLRTKEAREVCQCLLTRKNIEKFDSFEINYLLKSE